MGRPCGAGGCPGGKSPWPSLLLAAAVLSPCILLIQGQERLINVVADPAKPKAGGEVTLIPQGAMNDSISCRWYRGAVVSPRAILIWYGPPVNSGAHGLQYSNRETIQPDTCALRLTKLNSDDCATFFVSLDKPGLWENGRVNLEVEGLPCGGGRSGNFPSGLVAGGVIAGVAVASLLVVVAFGGLLYLHQTSS